MRDADTDALEEEYARGYDTGYREGVADMRHYRDALDRVREALTETLDKKVDPDRMQGYEIDQNDGERALARTLLAVIFAALSGREEPSAGG